MTVSQPLISPFVPLKSLSIFNLNHFSFFSLPKKKTVASSSKGATYMNLEGFCNQEATFYYLFSTEGARGLTYLQIIQRAWTFIPSSLTDPYNYHTGFANIYMTTANELITTVYNNALMYVENLKPSTVYNITGFCANGNDLYSTIVQQTATTKGNSGIFLTITFTFSESIKQDMAKMLACYLVIFFKIPAP